jgi:hypothetical protein
VTCSVLFGRPPGLPDTPFWNGIASRARFLVVNHVYANATSIKLTRGATTKASASRGRSHPEAQDLGEQLVLWDDIRTVRSCVALSTIDGSI